MFPALGEAGFFCVFHMEPVPDEGEDKGEAAVAADGIEDGNEIAEACKACGKAHQRHDHQCLALVTGEGGRFGLKEGEDRDDAEKG